MRITSLIVTICTLVTTQLQGDQVHLETGEMLVGKILRMSNEEISIQLKGGGIVSFQADKVSQVHKSYEEPQETLPTFDVSEKYTQRAERQEAKGIGTRKKSPFPPQASANESVVLTLPFKPPAATQGLVMDPDQRFAVVPPKNFVVWSDGVSPAVPISYREPITYSNFTVSTYPSKDPIRETKKKALRAYTANFKSFTILQDDKVKRGTRELIPETWLVEIESRIGGVKIQQLQVFTKNKDQVYILTYSAAGDTYLRHKKLFEDSIRTFHFLEPRGKVEAGDGPARKKEP